MEILRIVSLYYDDQTFRSNQKKTSTDYCKQMLIYLEEMFVLQYTNWTKQN